jgi:hypothetical protein
MQSEAGNAQPPQQPVGDQRFRCIADCDGQRNNEQDRQRSCIIVQEDGQVGQKGAGQDRGPHVPSEPQQQHQREAGRRPDRAGIALRQRKHQAQPRQQIVRSSSEQQGG